ncbi:hypothetical protein OIE63_21330 [Streptomyces sp. NBC_01795]|uniref:hypothetical protein n=1 Tax=unclassified Streptomyces TaxID=2593676 RepID=UPI002DDAD31F|nr:MULTISPECIES: hypothetical protein [unclassified Streptomyces]WSA93836.1 hypothetical protein OIE63_21330 [Streptomyces sp. NBC_01795]WSS13538.1 hypothetical protein OG533_17790 [Streptomyces sp. NBC_01186]
MSDGGEYGRAHDPAGPGGTDPAYGRDPGRLTTRTRLPGSEGSGGRPPTRPGRSLITIVAVVVLLIAAIAFANRGGGKEDGKGGGGSAEEGRNGGAQAQPTAPTGQKPVKPGTDTPASGFAHTEQGAQSAAANYAVALGGDGMFNRDRRHDIVEAVAAPSSKDKLQSGFDSNYTAKLNKTIGLDKEGKAPSKSTFVNRTLPAGSEVRSYKSDKATVAVWSNSLFGLAAERSTKPVKTSWFTMTFKLRWHDGDWKVVDMTQKDGPTPVSGDSPISGADEIGEATKKFGGFTYAR